MFLHKQFAATLVAFGEGAAGCHLEYQVVWVVQEQTWSSMGGRWEITLDKMERNNKFISKQVAS